MEYKNTSVRLKPDDQKRLNYVKTQLEKSTGLTVSLSDALIMALREFERTLRQKEQDQK